LDEIRAIAIVVVAAAIAALATPLVQRLALTVGAVDRPNERKVSHRERMPLMGGLAVIAGCLAGLATAFLLSVTEGAAASIAGFAAGAAILVLVGAWDDRFTMNAPPKLLFQVIAAAIAISAGFRVDFFTNPFTATTYPVPVWIVWPISLLWIVGVTNAMNLIDGLDGLASGVGAIIAFTLTIICWQAGQWPGVVIGFALFGALLGYLPFNFPPARIFLGDTGSLLIGFGLSLLALEGYRKAALLAFLVPILALAIPILDTALSILRRLRSGASVFDADRLHMHHRLLVREGSHRNAVLMLYFLTACFCMIALSFSQLDGWLAFAYLAAVVAVTVRLLRNLDAFSLEVRGGSSSDSGKGETPSEGTADGESLGS
jgi:UDP-GlcNAc:undecaprenyl-phosphate GlcNAc-1-phosphate transferase